MTDRGALFASLRSRNYRLWISGQSVSLIGTWMQRVAQDWLVLGLTHNSALLLGVVIGLQFGPTLVLSVWGGVLADRHDKRRMLLCTQTLLALCALSLGLLQITGVVRLWHVMAIAFVMGCVAAIEGPARQAFTIEMVGPDKVANAVGLNSMAFNLAGVIGPAISGVLIGVVGTGWVFLINFFSFVGVGAALLSMNPSKLCVSKPVSRSKGQLRQGFSYVWNRPDLRLVMLTVFLVATFGMNFQVSLAMLARETFHRGAASYGLLSTALAVGTLLGATIAARRTGRVRMSLFYGSAISFGVVEALASQMPTYASVAAALVPTGLFSLVFSTAALDIVQLSVDSQFRGRVMGIYMVAFLGGTPLGSPMVGWITDITNARMPLFVGGMLTALSGLMCAALMQRRPYRVDAEDLSGDMPVAEPAPSVASVCHPVAARQS